MVRLKFAGYPIHLRKRAWLCHAITPGILAILSGVGHGDDAAAESNYSTAKFLTECKAGLAKLEQRASHCRGRYKLINGGHGLDYQLIRDAEFAVSGDQMLLKTHLILEKRRGKPDKIHDEVGLRAANPDYSFFITPHKDSGHYRLQEHELASDAASHPPGGRIRNRITAWLDPALATHWMGFFPLMPLLDHPTFRLVKLTDRIQDGLPVVRAEFESRPGEPKTDPRVSWTRDRVYGWFEVAPTEGWTVRNFEYTYFAAGATPKVPLAKARVVGHVDYKPGPDGLPIVAHCKQETAWVDGPLDPYTEISDVEIEFAPTPEEQFRLSYYDLPEPVGVPPLPRKRSTLYWWLLGAAGVFLVGAVAFRRLARKRIHSPAAAAGGA